jgi:hypothetical protein
MCNCKFLKYNVSTQIYVQAGDVRVVDHVNALLLHNTGNTNLIVNGDILIPGQSKSIGGNVGEIFAGPLELRFMIPSPAPSPITNEVRVTQKFYVNVER